MDDKLIKSEEIINKAIEKYDPKIIAVMFSGGNDSMTVYQLTKVLKIPINVVIHCNTRTGIPETTEFVRSFMIKESVNYLEADSGSAYEDYLYRKGFFGVGISAHSYAYHILKATTFRKAIASIRKRRRNFNALLINGARKTESSNRQKKLTGSTNVDPGAKTNIWVNPMLDWTKNDCQNFLDYCNAPINPVTTLLCRSGECMCGTTQSMEQRKEASFFFPEWGSWLNELEKNVKCKHGFGWGEHMPKSKPVKTEFMPACHNCIHNK